MTPNCTYCKKPALLKNDHPTTYRRGDRTVTLSTTYWECSSGCPCPFSEKQPAVFRWISPDMCEEHDAQARDAWRAKFKEEMPPSERVPRSERKAHRGFLKLTHDLAADDAKRPLCEIEKELQAAGVDLKALDQKVEKELARALAKEELVKAYQEMYEITEPECRTSCRCPQSCCSAEYCESTIAYALDAWQTVLTPTGHARFPLMGPTGCVAAPHLRPLCTMHTCDVSGLGGKRGDPEWTRRYLKLRAHIEVLSLKAFY